MGENRITSNRYWESVDQYLATSNDDPSTDVTASNYVCHWLER